MALNSSTLADKVALVTGASSGIGRAVALDLARQGVAVVIQARREARLRELADEIAASGGKALVHTSDAGELDAVDALADASIAWQGRLDIVVVNAGRGLAGGVLSSDPSTWEALYRVNVTGAVYLMRRAAQHMVERGGGDIVALGSVAGHNISPFSGFYGSSKWAVAAAAEALRREVCSRGIRVTTVKPGIVISEFQEVAGYNAENFFNRAAECGRLLDPDDVARAITFVVSQPPSVNINELVIRPTGQDYP